MKIKIDQKSLNNAAKSIKKLSSDTTEATRSAVRSSAEFGRSKMAERAPVDTGTLRNSMQILDITLDGYAIKFGTNIEYADFQERRVGFGARAREDAERDFQQRINNLIQNS